MEFQIHRRPRSPSAWLMFVPGGACVLLGILILLMPQLLVTLVAGGLMVIGSIMLSLAWRFRAGSSSSMFKMFRDRFPG